MRLSNITPNAKTHETFSSLDAHVFKQMMHLYTSVSGSGDTTNLIMLIAGSGDATNLVNLKNQFKYARSLYRSVSGSGDTANLIMFARAQHSSVQPTRYNGVPNKPESLITGQLSQKLGLGLPPK